MSGADQVDDDLVAGEWASAPVQVIAENSRCKTWAGTDTINAAITVGRAHPITADAGGSNSYRTRLWKVELGRLAARTGGVVIGADDDEALVGGDVVHP